MKRERRTGNEDMKKIMTTKIKQTNMKGDGTSENGSKGPQYPTSTTGEFSEKLKKSSPRHDFTREAELRKHVYVIDLLAVCNAASAFARSHTHTKTDTFESQL
jgi:hypothetical protein